MYDRFGTNSASHAALLTCILGCSLRYRCWELSRGPFAADANLLNFLTRYGRSLDHGGGMGQALGRVRRIGRNDYLAMKERCVMVEWSLLRRIGIFVAIVLVLLLLVGLGVLR